MQWCAKVNVQPTAHSTKSTPSPCEEMDEIACGTAAAAMRSASLKEAHFSALLELRGLCKWGSLGGSSRAAEHGSSVQLKHSLSLTISCALVGVGAGRHIINTCLPELPGPEQPSHLQALGSNLQFLRRAMLASGHRHRREPPMHRNGLAAISRTAAAAGSQGSAARNFHKIMPPLSAVNFSLSLAGAAGSGHCTECAAP